MTTKEKLQFFATHGLSMSYIAEKMGVDPSTLTKWVKGQKGITHKNEDKVLLTLQEIIQEMQEALGGS